MTTSGSGTLHGPVQMWLTVGGANGPERTVEVSLPRFVIGRDETCDLVLDDPKVSRRHAEILQGSGPFRTVRDLDSANGMLVNGLPLNAPPGFGRKKEVDVSGGALLLVGDTPLLLTLTDPREGSG